MINKYVLLILTTYLLTSVQISANEVAPIALEKMDKSQFYPAIAPQTAKKIFPAIYIYHVKNQQILSEQDAKSYLNTLNQAPLWLDVAKWARDTSQFNTNNQALSQSLPQLKLDREYVIYYDNIPEAMLSSFKSMDANLIEKDKLLKSVLSAQTNSRSYVAN